MSQLLPLDSHATRAVVGGKGANLARLIGTGLNVPAARCVAVDDFTEHVAACRAGGAADDDAMREAIIARPLDQALSAALRQFAEQVGGRVSLRSSGTLEDAHTHAFAGQFLTVLDVGPDDVADAVRRVWASVFTNNVRVYLERAELDGSKLQMAVVVQRQLDSEASGVALGDANRAMIEAVFGQGEAVVGAEVESDHWDLQSGRIVGSRIAHKVRRLMLPDGPPTGTLERLDLPAEMRDAPSLTPPQVLQVADLAGRLAASFDRRPQDCEFSFIGDELFVLQTRDVTTSLPVEAPPLGPWTPPGKGVWELDDSHFVRPVTQIFADRFPSSMRRGFQIAAARYGALLSHLDFEVVNRFAYSRMRPVAAPEDATAKDPPPAFLFKILSRLVPELRRRIATAHRIWADREWRRQADEWVAAKRSSIEAHLALQTVDLTALDDAALIDHMRALDGHVDRMIQQHHTYNLAAMVPTGDLLTHVARWVGDELSQTDILSLLVGASDVSADLRSPEAQRLARSVAASPAARALLRLDEPAPALSDVAAAQALESLRALEDEAGQQARSFLEQREYRLSEGLDLAAPCLREVPTLLWRAVRDAALSATESSTDDASDRALLERCRGAIPAPHRATFDELLAEARLTYHLRDERSLYSDVWAWGILRSACLEIGARLFRRSPARVVEPADAVQASLDELQTLLLDDEGPSAQDLQRRAAFQHAYSIDDAPTRLGPDPRPPPPADMLPAGAARLSEALSAAIALALPQRGAAPSAGARELAGRPASAGSYEGRAHVVTTAKDAEAMPAGSVLVVGTSSSVFTMLAPLADAVIAEGGGLLSHVAIVCREYRIPCVCGCVGVLQRVKTGDRVRVDGTHGKVVLLDSDDPTVSP